MRGVFTDPQSEEVVRGWICSNGVERLLETIPGLKGTGFSQQLRTIYNAACEIEEAGNKVNNLSLFDHLLKQGLLEKAGGAANLLPGHDTWTTAEFALFKLKECHQKRVVADTAKKMAAGMTPAEAIERLEPIAFNETDSALKERRFDIRNPPPRAIPRLYLGDQGVCTPGNISLITGQIKSGKSASVCAVLATSMDSMEHLAIKGTPNDLEHAVIHFDTEQSRFDHHQLVRRAMQRAGVQAIQPWIRSYSLADITTEKRRKYLISEIATAKRDHGGVHLVIIDGVADLCLDPNDPKEAFSLVEELHRIAIKFDCPILGVLHLNPGSDYKTRGHLGSQLERKAESVIALEKDKNETVTMFLKVARHGQLDKNSGPRFAWNDSTSRHEIVEGTRKDVREKEKQEEVVPELTHLAQLVLKPNGPRKYHDFIQDISTLRGVRTPTAKRLFTKMKTYSIIEKDLLNCWKLVGLELEKG